MPGSVFQSKDEPEGNGKGGRRLSPFWESSERSVAIFAGMILGWSGALV